MDVSYVLAGLTTVLAGFFAFVFKEIPKNIAFRIYQLISNSISVISINDEDYIFLNEWLYNKNIKMLKKHIELKYVYTPNGGKSIPSLGYGNFFCKYGFLTFINVNKRKIDNNIYSADEITVSFYGLHGKKIFKEFNNSFNNKNNGIIKVFTNDPRFYIKEPRKSFDTIFNKSIDKIKEHLDKWLDSEYLYNKSGDPYKTGILLYGPPGTGKSTIARAIATYLNFDLHVISMSDYKETKELAERVSRIPSNSVVLLDDVDTMIKSRNEIDKMSSSNQKDYYSYIQSVMNMLDGAISPNKVVFVACTNYIDKLDDAFKRPSRFDLQLEISNITYDDAVRMCNYYGVDVNVLQGIELPCSPAKLKHIIFNNVDI